jgi:RND superfamily putative drug exporter
MQTLARWCFTHRRLVVGLWMLLAVLATAGSRLANPHYEDNLKLPGTGSNTAAALLRAAEPRAGDVDQLVFAVDTGRVIDPPRATQITAVLTRIGTLPHVTAVVSPLSNPRQVSADGRIAYATVAFDRDGRLVPASASKAVLATADSITGSGLHIGMNGLAAAQIAKPSIGGAGFGIIAAAIVLVIAFGSPVAAALPLATAVISLSTGLGVIGMLSHALSMATFTTQLASLIALGVGIDYAMFIVSRYRNALQSGTTPLDATITAVNTSGRAVAFAGATVCIALLGMFTLGVSIFYGVAIAASLAVTITLAAALTLQPALLGFAGTAVLRPRDRDRITPVPDSRRWASWAAQLRRRPAALAAVGTAVIAVLALPLLSLNLGFSDAANDPAGTSTRQAYDLLARGFGPGVNGPLQLVASTPDEPGGAVFAAVLRAVAGQPDVAAVTPPVQFGAGGHQIETASVLPLTAPQDPRTTALLDHLRRQTIPTATNGTALRVAVGGVTALNADFSHRLSQRMPWLIATVVTMSALLLLVVFRSLLIPLTAAAMNLLSVAAAFGVITAVFNWGWLGIARTGPIEPFIPVIVFAILFGLSMDYEVFLVARIQEEWHHGADNTRAVTTGLTRTGRTITAAAAIMFAVFASFTLGDNRIVKLFGLGLASAVLIDAVIVRTLLLPAVMLLLGRHNWTLPARWNTWCPHCTSRHPTIPSSPPVAPNRSQPQPAGPHDAHIFGGKVILNPYVPPASRMVGSEAARGGVCGRVPAPNPNGEWLRGLPRQWPVLPWAGMARRRWC